MSVPCHKGIAFALLYYLNLGLQILRLNFLDAMHFSEERSHDIEHILWLGAVGLAISMFFVLLIIGLMMVCTLPRTH